MVSVSVSTEFEGFLDYREKKRRTSYKAIEMSVVAVPFSFRAKSSDRSNASLDFL
jgi:hypothetical protein